MATALDRDRFEKCRAMWRRGATTGERSAGKAAAERVAAAAGLTLKEASQATRALRAPVPHAFAPTKRAPEPGPTTIAAGLAQKAADLVRKKERARRAERAERKQHAEWEEWHAGVRAEQAARDAAWAEERSQRAA